MLSIILRKINCAIIESLTEEKMGIKKLTKEPIGRKLFFLDIISENILCFLEKKITKKNFGL